ncbi:MAG: type I phosphomannose isomerase catalytic subunit [Verrucomicrobiota bacterium]|nr:type I phosphomannose isomerase catalytic subunit [Verrucomicrobiota bacterium]
MNIICFQPIYQERVWGGDALATKLGRSLPAGKVIGESWEVVDRPEACSVVLGGEFNGQTLRQVLLSSSPAIMGPRWQAQRPFPVLVKWLDASDRLSLQVHPPARVATELKGEPKTENWYVADADPQAAFFVGFKHGVTRTQFEAALRTNDLEPLIHRIPSHKGDSLFVESGRLHALDGGNLILEIQQNSDTTYRVYDWGRVGLDGKPRTLHIEESLKSIDYNDFEPEALHTAGSSGEVVLVDSAIFRLRKISLPAGGRLSFAAQQEPRLLHIVEGEVTETATKTTLTRSQNVLLPYAGAYDFISQQGAVVLVTDRFGG